MKVCFVLSKPRSGTTVFRRTLETHPAIYDAGEIFNEANEGSFFHYLASLTEPVFKLVAPSYRRDLFATYIAHLSSSVTQYKPSAMVCLIDVKYDHFHLVYDGWRDYFSLPIILDMIKHNEQYVIDIHRTNVLNAIIFNVLAQRTGIYHIEPGFDSAAQDIKQIFLDKDETMSKIAIINQRYAMVHDYFEHYGRYVCIKYEDMFAADGSRMAREPLAEVANILDLPFDFDDKPRLRKIIEGDPLDYVTNREEILSAYNSAMANE